MYVYTYIKRHMITDITINMLFQIHIYLVYQLLTSYYITYQFYIITDIKQYIWIWKYYWLIVTVYYFLLFL